MVHAFTVKWNPNVFGEFQNKSTDADFFIFFYK